MRLLVLALVLLAAGCVSRQGPVASGPGSTTEETTTTTTSDEAVPVSPDDAADGTDYAACTDGTCEVYVTGMVIIPLGSEFGFTEFRVIRTPYNTTVFGTDPVNDDLITDLEGTGQLSANGITMDVLVADETGAILAFSPSGK